MSQGNAAKIATKFVKILLIQFKRFLLRNFNRTIIALHVVINIWFTSCLVKYMVNNIAVKPMANLDTGGITRRITVRKV